MSNTENDSRTAVRLPTNFANAIRELLPENISKLLRERLDEADAALAERDNLHALVETLNERAATTQKIASDRAALERESAALAKERDAFETERRNHLVDKLRHELSVQKEATALLGDTLKSLVRNTEFRRDIYRTHVGENGCMTGVCDSETEVAS